MRRPASLRGKMIGVTVSMLTIVGAAALYTSFATAALARSLGLLFQRNQLIEEIRSGVALSAQALSGYLTSRSSGYLDEYREAASTLASRARTLDREVRSDEAILLQRELAGLVDRYILDAEAAVAAKSEGRIATYTARFESTVRTAELARVIVERIERRNLAVSIEAYAGLDSRIAAVVATNAALVVAALLMAFTIFIRYAWTITKPLSTLADSARSIASGDYDRELPLLEGPEEIETVAAAFENMRKGVRNAFGEIKSKGEIERRLIEEDLRLVDMDRRLKDAELLALQAQINPHFLFNTLAAGMQLALAEGAERTGDFLEKLSGFIRYALKSPSRSVLVADELECVELYVWLLRLRFGERYEFQVQAEEDALSAETPALILQPLVENAVTHGLHDLEEGGLVRVLVRTDGAEVLLEVSDTGVGMGQDELESLRAEGGEASDGAREAGIGLRNVMRRVTLATGGRGRVELESAPGRGTTVRVRLPAAGAGKPA
jgi:two-component system sensor histidine kinase YesM